MCLSCWFCSKTAGKDRGKEDACSCKGRGSGTWLKPAGFTTTWSVNQTGLLTVLDMIWQKFYSSYRRCNIWVNCMQRHVTFAWKGGEIVQFSQKCTHASFQYFFVRLKKLRLWIHGLLSNIKPFGQYALIQSDLVELLSKILLPKHLRLRFQTSLLQSCWYKTPQVFAHWNWWKMQRHCLYGGFLKWWYPKMDDF